MIKTISPRMWDYGEPPVDILKVSRAGLIGHDLRSFIKRAGDEAGHRMRLLAKDLPPDEEYVHMLAMGATEIISPNKNGDGWKIAQLIASHPTFVKYGFYHRNHKVAESDGVYGKIRDSWYNPAMGRVELINGFFTTKEAAERAHAKRGRVADKEIQIISAGRELPVSMSGYVPWDECFKAGTLVDTEFGMRPIEKLKVGEYVRTHTGALRKITRVLKRAYSGTMIDIQVMGVPEVISTTAEHPFLVAKKTSVRSCHGSVKNRNGKREKRRHSFNDSNICTGCKKDVKLQRDWTAAQEIKVGDFVTCPMLTPGLWEIGTAKAYLLGFYAGDGSIIKKTRTREKLTENVASGLSFSLDNTWPEVNNLVKAYADEINGNDHTLHPAGRDKESQAVHLYDSDFSTDVQFLIGTYSEEKLLNEEIFNLCRADRLALLAGWVDSDGCTDFDHRVGTIRISSINRSLVEQCKRLIAGMGFNASVIEHTNSGYSQSLIYAVSAGRDLWDALANFSAKIGGKLAPGRTLKATVSADNYTHMPIQEVRHYYEECDVFNLSVEADETYIVSGVVVHNCSGCGNRARGRNEYCKSGQCKYGGLYRNIGKVFEDGHHLHANNPDTKFFDISGIFNEDSLEPEKQADRIAYVLGRIKAASFSDFEALEDHSLPLPLLMEAGDWVGKQATVLTRMVEIESSNSGLTYYGSAIDGEKIDGDLVSPQTMNIMKKLAKQGICLSIEDFAKLCGNEELAPSAKVFAKSAMKKLSRSYSVQEQLESNPFKFDHQFTQTDPRKALFLMTPESVRKRAWLSDMSETIVSNEREEKTGSAEALADLHALYRLGFCASLPKSSNLVLISDYIARHNL